jgi:hypothetical protein
MLAAAQETTTPTAAPTTTGVPRNICSNIGTLRDKALSRLSTRVTEIQGKRGEHQAKFQAGRSDRHAKLLATRTEHDAARQARYQKLRSHASTTEQVAAVNVFQTEVERLVTVRKAAVDAAIAAFEDGAAALQTKSDTAVTSFSTTMQDDITKIFADASASCTAGTKGSDVLAAIKSAMAAKKAARESDPKSHPVRDEFQALQATRKASIDAAVAAFKTGMDAATKNLKAAFPKKAA